MMKRKSKSVLVLLFLLTSILTMKMLIDETPSVSLQHNQNTFFLAPAQEVIVTDGHVQASETGSLFPHSPLADSELGKTEKHFLDLRGVGLPPLP
ncbi:MAG: hypothetical protein AAFY71_06265 [Bacteroidota bacterium]